MKYRRPIRLPADAYRVPDAMFHLAMRAHPRFAAWPPAVRALIWAALEEEFASHRATIALACLMPNHLHVLATMGTVDVIRWADGFKSLTTHRYRASGGVAVLWQPRTWDRQLRSSSARRAAWSYVARNPVVAGLCEEPHEWPWTCMNPELPLE